MAKFSDLPPEIAEQIVEWVDLITRDDLVQIGAAHMQAAAEIFGGMAGLNNGHNHNHNHNHGNGNPANNANGRNARGNGNARTRQQPQPNAPGARNNNNQNNGANRPNANRNAAGGNQPNGNAVPTENFLTTLMNAFQASIAGNIPVTNRDGAQNPTVNTANSASTAATAATATSSATANARATGPSQSTASPSGASRNSNAPDADENMQTAPASTHSPGPFSGFRTGFLLNSNGSASANANNTISNPTAQRSTLNQGNNPFAGMFSTRPNTVGTAGGVGLNLSPQTAASHRVEARPSRAAHDLDGMPSLVSPTRLPTMLNADATASNGDDSIQYESDNSDEADDSQDEDGDSQESGWETDESNPPPLMSTLPDFRVDPATWSYPDGLPGDNLLPLALVSRSFLYGARKLLYGDAKYIVLASQYQVALCVRTLTNKQVSPFADGTPGFYINQHVKGFHIQMNGPNGQDVCSLGRGGVNLVIEGLQACPHISTLDFRVDCLRSAWEPLAKAMVELNNLEELRMRSGSDEVYPLVLSADRLANLCSNWPKIRLLDLYGLSTNREMTPIAPFAAHLTEMALTASKVTGSELEAILAGSADSLTALKLHEVPSTITRGVLATILLKHAANLKTLSIQVTQDWHPRSTAAAPTASSENSAYFLNTIVGKFKKLKQLTWRGSLANAGIFALLPNSIETLHWGDNLEISPMRVAKILSMPNKNGRRRVPKLKCVTISNDDGHWSNQELSALSAQLKLREACLHLSEGESIFAGAIPVRLNGGVGIGAMVPMPF